MDGYTRLFNTYDPAEVKIQSIKKALTLGSPVVVGFICPPSFQFATDFWQPREGALPEHGIHAVLVAGYNDATLGGAFQIVNSWGRSWGKNGTTKLRYEDVGGYFLYGFRLLRSTRPAKARVEFLSAEGTEMTATEAGGVYKLDKTYKTGDKFRVRISCERGLFVSAYAIDAAGNTGPLMQGNQDNQTWIDSELSLPSVAGYYPLTEPAGENRLVFAFANSELALDDFVPTKKPIDQGVKWEKRSIGFVSTQDLTIVSVIINQR
jgi:hypothetical protein